MLGCGQTVGAFQAGAALKADTPQIVTDHLREIPELASLEHVFVKATDRVNNRAEYSHQPTRERERRTRGFREPKSNDDFAACV
ncbi:transposase-like protein [Paraburkholderia atlantica]